MRDKETERGREKERERERERGRKREREREGERKKEIEGETFPTIHVINIYKETIIRTYLRKYQDIFPQ